MPTPEQEKFFDEHVAKACEDVAKGVQNTISATMLQLMKLPEIESGDVAAASAMTILDAAFIAVVSRYIIAASMLGIDVDRTSATMQRSFDIGSQEAQRLLNTPGLCERAYSLARATAAAFRNPQ